MTISIFVSYWIPGMDSADVKAHFCAEPLTLLRSKSSVVSVEHYVPASGDDLPKFDDIPAPTLIVQIDVDSPSNAIALTESKDFNNLFLNKNTFESPFEKINLEIVEAVHYDLPGHATPPARTKPFSFVVRYYGPVEDAIDFVNFYTDNHPPILAKFPNIRNVLCYLPLDWKGVGKISDQRMVIGNEVVFDDVAGLNAALQSPVFNEAMADSEQFKDYGYSSHHAMWRDFVYQQGK